MKNLILSALMILTAVSCEKKITETVDTQTATPDSIVVPESNEPLESSTLQTCYMEATG